LRERAEARTVKNLIRWKYADEPLSRTTAVVGWNILAPDDGLDKDERVLASQ
jgi:hypothetical protein